MISGGLPANSAMPLNTYFFEFGVKSAINRPVMALT